MNNYRYPLITSGAFLMLLSSQPLMALNPTPAAQKAVSEELRTEIALSSSTTADPEIDRASDIASQLFKSPEAVEGSKKEAIAPVNSSPVAQLPTYSPPPPTYSPPGQTFQAPGSNNPGVLVPNPEVLIKSNGGSIPDSLQPTMPVAPTLPRAIAPPVGDMAISNINAGASQIDLGSSAIVPRLVLRQAPAREVLAVLARYAGMNLVFTDQAGGGKGQGQGAQAGQGAEPTVSLDLENEPVQDVFNSVLMISGLQANRRGRTIFVGSQLPQAAQNLVSRSLRLNQVKASNAGVFLASQGAEFQRLVTQTEDIIDPLTQRVIGRRELPGELQALQSQSPEGSIAPMLLTGLTVSSDDRLNTITLVGEPRHVQVATSLLTQMDARRRQVAVNVKVVDVTLTNDQSFSSQWSFGSGDAFIVQDNGAAVLRFGGTSPTNSSEINGAPGRVSNPPAILNPFGDANTFINPNSSIIVPGVGVGTVVIDPATGQLLSTPADAQFFGRVAGISMDPTIAGITDITPGTANTFNSSFDPVTGARTFTISPGTVPTATGALPSYFQFPKRFLAQIETTIQSGNGKVLTDPTLVVQEGQEATVKLTQKVIENITTQVDPLSGVRTTTPVLQDAGLTLTINVDKIDDNGYISLTVSPTIASVGDVQQFDSGSDGGTNNLFLLNRRELTSGLIRLRDGQTLILSGIISEADQTVTNKVPLLGDLPVIGALFRSQQDSSQRTEVIVLLTPQILHDNGQWGYNYQPGRGTAEVLRDQGFPVQLIP
ncbi:secretin and TonB N-terminal domain-containing protein [Crocosphaera sp. XPORK-15E]|uniref:secretin and TonB N-terminal domain-containing protein n=1 Tax=Crocosphaera sp. XPORK-15E TaxID=3110247 RepID=UPI002B1F15A2|nr:secretin and TonB N-terminal domain-containing protein [Crocosphaera sp. XPORK-15E]MEA5537315.1 secretin and TonB N-terminal domain-containing protein [Crocosphaera sp. XPORK-15E]